MYSQVSLTLTGRFIPRPRSCSLTCASTVSYQVVAHITSVHGCLLECGFIDTYITIGGGIQSPTINNC